VATIAHPCLVLAWAGDPGHPASTAERLVELLPRAELHVATRIRDVLGWPTQVAAFLDTP
jgi:pimeloyl-ACP methyl ester carboxylesterase